MGNLVLHPLISWVMLFIPGKARRLRSHSPSNCSTRRCRSRCRLGSGCSPRPRGPNLPSPCYSSSSSTFASSSCCGDIVLTRWFWEDFMCCSTRKIWIINLDFNSFVIVCHRELNSFPDFLLSLLRLLICLLLLIRRFSVAADPLGLDQRLAAGPDEWRGCSKSSQHNRASNQISFQCMKILI